MVMDWDECIARLLDERDRADADFLRASAALRLLAEYVATVTGEDPGTLVEDYWGRTADADLVRLTLGGTPGGGRDDG